MINEWPWPKRVPNRLNRNAESLAQNTCTSSQRLIKELNKTLLFTVRILREAETPTSFAFKLKVSLIMRG